MPPFSPSHAIESLNTYFAALGVSTRRVNEAIASSVSDLLAERLALEIRTRFDSASPQQLLEVLSIVSPDAAAESLPDARPIPGLSRCDSCGAHLPRPPASCPCRINALYNEPLRTNEVTDLSLPTKLNPLCDLLPGGNKARKPHRSK